MGSALSFLIFFFKGSTLLNINNGTKKPCCCGTLFTVCVNCGSHLANWEGEEMISGTWWDWYMMVRWSTQTTNPLACHQTLLTDRCVRNSLRSVEI